MERTWINTHNPSPFSLAYVKLDDLLPINHISGIWDGQFDFSNCYFVLLGVF